MITKCPHCSALWECSEADGAMVDCSGCGKSFNALPLSEPDITFICSKCKQSLEAPLDMEGLMIDCPTCGQPLKVPATVKPQFRMALADSATALQNDNISDAASALQATPARERGPIIFSILLYTVIGLFLGGGFLFKGGCQQPSAESAPVESASTEPLVYKTIIEAAENGDIADVMLHLQNGADINAKNDAGQTPLMRAAMKGHLDTVRFLVEKGANIELMDDMVGLTPLACAAMRGYLDTVRFLAEKGANLNTKTQFGQTPLMNAALEGHLDTVRFLVEKGANIELRDMAGFTALRFATGKHHFDVANYLKAHGATE